MLGAQWLLRLTSRCFHFSQKEGRKKEKEGRRETGREGKKEGEGRKDRWTKELAFPWRHKLEYTHVHKPQAHSQSPARWPHPKVNTIPLEEGRSRWWLSATVDTIACLAPIQAPHFASGWIRRQKSLMFCRQWQERPRCVTQFCSSQRLWTCGLAFYPQLPPL